MFSRTSCRRDPRDREIRYRQVPGEKRRLTAYAFWIANSADRFSQARRRYQLQSDEHCHPYPRLRLHLQCSNKLQCGSCTPAAMMFQAQLSYPSWHRAFHHQQAKGCGSDRCPRIRPCRYLVFHSISLSA